ncbi:MAG: DegV family protein [Lachnospiraceae bacterium]|nr:DegV family protein [Lachnospiraceae bacterium]
MNEYVISTCTSADMTKEKFEARNVEYCNFHYEMDGVTYPDDLFQTMSLEEFYGRIAKGADVKTSQINVDEFCNYFESFLKEGKDIIHLSLSSGISGVSNSAIVAANMMKEKYPDRKIYAFDSLCASSGMGLLVDKLCDLRDEGKSIDELAEFTEAHKKELQHWFFCTDLTAFIKGGRVTKTAGFIGTVMNICPLLHVDHEGKLIPMEKVRTKKKCFKRVVEKMEQYCQNGLDYADKVFISNSYCPEDAQAVADLIREKFPKVKDIEIYSIGSTIGCHTGIGTTALFFWGSERCASDS